MKKIIIILMVMLCLVACQYPLTEGTVYKKIYKSPTSGFSPFGAALPMFGYSGSREHFIIKIKKYNEKTGRVQTETYRILERKDWESIKVGDYFKHKRGRDFPVCDWEGKYDIPLN